MICSSISCCDFHHCRFIVLRSIFLRQSANERHIKEMGHAFIKLAYNDVMTETLNKKAMETYGTFIADKIAPERVSVIILTWMISNHTTTTTPT